MTLTASRRFDKCPTPGHRCSEKFPKMANARQMSGGIFLGGDGHAWNLHVLRAINFEKTKPQARTLIIIIMHVAQIK